MSIENDLKRIADALEQLVDQNKPGDNRTAHDVEQAISKKAIKAAEKILDPVVTDELVEAVKHAPKKKPMTLDALNGALLAEYQRLGGREEIDAVMTEVCGSLSINALKPSQRAEVLEKVKAL